MHVYMCVCYSAGIYINNLIVQYDDKHIAN